MSPELEQHLARYLELLLFWNRKVNLTAVRDPAEIRDRHFADSLEAVRHIPDEARSLVDIGSGAGFPGAVIALARPALEVTLVESVRKKASFLEALRRDIPLPNVTVFAMRAEDWARCAPALPDVAISRAVWDLSEWLAKAMAFVRPGGTVLGMEGAERHELPAGATRHPYGSRSIIRYVPRETSR
jgi:16S rRNA (guanine527-N7)-methyltransferase